MFSNINILLIIKANYSVFMNIILLFWEFSDEILIEIFFYMISLGKFRSKYLDELRSFVKLFSLKRLSEIIVVFERILNWISVLFRNYKLLKVLEIASIKFSYG